MNSKSHINETFREEAREELLPELENGLLELEKHPEDKDLINRVFRALHTLKGSGAMFGFETMSELAHEMETVFDGIRNGLCRVDHHLLELSLTAKDHLQLLVDEPEAMLTAQFEELRAVFREMAPDAAGERELKSDSGACYPHPAGAMRTWHIRFKPHANIFETGNNPLYLLDELRELGTARIIARVDDIPLLESLQPESSYMGWDILLTTDQDQDTIKDVFIFVESDCDLSFELVSEQARPAADGNVGSGSGRASVATSSSGFSERRSGKDRRETSTITSMRVQSSRLDHLVNLVGEMVIAQTRLSRLAEEKDDPTLTDIAEVMQRLTNELRDNTLDIRMMPIGASFGKFKRVVWDLSSRNGKEVELITEGAATELDKTVIERLNDPLVHLLRNSIDHGIEIPEERERIGKNRQGRIVFSAEHSGGNVIITISDDGRGIDTERVRTRAVEKGLLSPDSGVTEQDLLNLIFEPGFSTAEQVSDLSGRGVGMDVVRQNIAALKGKVRVSSEKGRGTTVRITLPLTLAIIEGLRIRIGREFFIIPLAVVSECLELERGKNGNLHQGRIINLRDQLVPVLRLRDWFSINGQKPEKEQVVVVSMEKSMVGLVADEVVGLQQTVIKNLDGKQKDVPGISGATIQGDGSIALILDVEPLIQKAEQKAFA
jgi:two-component system chemotaxis sensor kinase CheA